MTRFNLFILGAVCLLLSGCGAGFDAAPAPVLGASSAAIQGHAFGGQQPIVGALVTIYEAGTSGYGAGAIQKASVSTDASGGFAFTSGAYTCTAANSPMYLVVTGGNPGQGANANIALSAVLGSCSAAKSAVVTVNEVTTAATVLALGQFMGKTLGAAGNAYVIGGTCSGCATGTYNRGLVNAMTSTYPQLVNNATGTALATRTAGNQTTTTEAAKINTIANILAACINSNGQTSTADTTSNCGKLFSGVNATNAATRPSDTLQAALQMQLYPYSNVANVYALQTATAPFTGLSSVPNDWTVALSYTTSGFGLGISQNTTSVLDIDASGNIWVPSNKAGAVGLAVFNPLTATFSGPYGGSNLTYPQYVALDQSSPATAYVTDMASSRVNGVGTTSFSAVNSFASSAYTVGGPLSLDASNNILLAANTATTHSLYTIKAGRTSLVQAVDDFSDTFAPPATPNTVAVPLQVPFTNGYLYVGDTTTACRLEFSPGAQQGQSDVYTTGTSSCVVGGMVPAVDNNAYMTSSNNTVCFYVPFETSFNRCSTFSSLNVPKAIALDGANRFWIANSGNASVAAFNVSQSTFVLSAIGSGYLHDANNGNTLGVPYGLAIDGSGNVWVSNASCVATSSTPCSATSFTLTELVGVAAPAITPLSYQEIGSSPASGTKPSN